MRIRAAGLYLRVLREAQGLGRSKPAHLIGTDDSQIERIEKGQVDTRSTMLARFVRAVSAGAEDVVTLLLLEDDTDDLARRMAHQWLARAQRLPPEQAHARRVAAHSLIDALPADPQKLDQLLGYGARLLEEAARDAA